jgi:hypothetical protein
LIGFALGLWAIDHPTTGQFRELQCRVAPRTTRLSAAHLAAAAEGEAPEAWHDLVGALASSPGDLDSHRLAILDWGASSGRHTLFAFLSILAQTFDSAPPPSASNDKSTRLSWELSA